MARVGNQQEQRTRHITASEQVTSSATLEVVDTYRSSAKLLGWAAGVFLVIAVLLFAVGLFQYAGVACLGSILNAVVATYLVRAARRLTRET